MKSVIDLVDSIEYTTTNCFTHQLHNALHNVSDVSVRTVALSDIERVPPPDYVVCRLKQRTLHRCLQQIKQRIGNSPIVVFDQDPWENFRVGSPFVGTYEAASACLNIKAFAVTTKWWADYIASKGMPSTFVRMWVLPEYCTSTPTFIDRSISLGFMGSIHGHRKKLFDELQQLSVNVNVQQGGMQYKKYLKTLSSMQCFIHTANNEIQLHDGTTMNMNVGLWIKDVEAAARGCFSIRDRGSDSETYLEGIKTLRLFDDPREVPMIVHSIGVMDPKERQSVINNTVKYVQETNLWASTAQTLIRLVTAP